MSKLPVTGNKTAPQSSPRRLFARCTALAALAGAWVGAHAATYYQTANQSGSGSWDQLPAWNSAPDGSGTAPAAINATDDFVCNTGNWTLRSPATSFGGKSLTLGPASHSLLLKSGTANITIPSLFTSGAAAIKSGSNNSTLSVTTWVAGYGTTLISNHTATNALFPLSVGTLTGSADFNLTGGATGTLKLTITDATSYLGTITLASGKLEFLNALSSGGAFVVTTPGDVTLNHAVTFTGLTVAGVVKTPGTYAAASLGFAGTGSVTVRTAATWYLLTNQASAQNWTAAFLSNWNSLTSGAGVAPASINAFDHYINQGAGRELRTPVAASTFGGGSLTLANTAKLTVKAPAGAVSTIPVFITTGTPSIANGYGNIRQDLSLGDWDITAGTTKLSASAGRSLAFDIDYLTGAGGLQTQNGGAFFLKVNNGAGYTGTLDHASGSLRFENPFSTRGAFNVGSSATVTLDQPVYFASFTVAGVAQPAGIQTYATLNAAYPAQFPAGSASGLVGVYVPDTAGPVPMRGVNISGPESNTANLPGAYGTNYVYPTVADFDYYHSKGMNLIRIPFRWERMQTSLNSPLNAAQLGYMDTAIARASARGMKVIIDLHNYGECKIAGSIHKLGTTALPVSAFADVWRRLADHYKDEPAIYGYDIMNEPHGLAPGVWVSAAQAAILAIRESDLNHDIIVEGEYWANAWGFEAKNPKLHTLRDPLNRLIFSAHSYWSDAGTDDYKTYAIEGAYPMMGVDNVKPFVDWLKKYGFKGFVGEYGVPNNDPQWLPVLENFLAYIEAEGLSGTYWAGGGWYTNNINCHPSSNYTVDKPVMTVLDDHP